MCFLDMALSKNHNKRNEQNDRNNHAPRKGKHQQYENVKDRRANRHNRFDLLRVGLQKKARNGVYTDNKPKAKNNINHKLCNFLFGFGRSDMPFDMFRTDGLDQSTNLLPRRNLRHSQTAILIFFQVQQR